VQLGHLGTRKFDTRRRSIENSASEVIVNDAYCMDSIFLFRLVFDKLLSIRTDNNRYRNYRLLSVLIDNNNIITYLNNIFVPLYV
jgi:hypothetical protein